MWGQETLTGICTPKWAVYTSATGQIKFPCIRLWVYKVYTNVQSHSGKKCYNVKRVVSVFLSLLFPTNTHTLLKQKERCSCPKPKRDNITWQWTLTSLDLAHVCPGVLCSCAGKGRAQHAVAHGSWCFLFHLRGTHSSPFQSWAKPLSGLLKREFMGLGGSRHLCFSLPAALC